MNILEMLEANKHYAIVGPFLVKYTSRPFFELMLCLSRAILWLLSLLLKYIFSSTVHQGSSVCDSWLWEATSIIKKKYVDCKFIFIFMDLCIRNCFPKGGPFFMRGQNQDSESIQLSQAPEWWKDTNRDAFKVLLGQQIPRPLFLSVCQSLSLSMAFSAFSFFSSLSYLCKFSALLCYLVVAPGSWFSLTINTARFTLTSLL